MRSAALGFLFAFLTLHVALSAKAKVLILGGGIASLQAAYHLLFVPRQTLKTLFTFPNPFQSDSISYSKQKVLRYTPEQVFNVVADVDSYKYFLPWCRDSRVYDRKGTKAKGLMIVGFPPFVERYTSDMTLIKPSLVRSIASGDKLFKELITEWKMNGVEEKCVVDFNISFQFRSSLHSKVATVFFDEVARTMVGAFERRCADLYGFRPISKKNVTPQK